MKAHTWTEAYKHTRDFEFTKRRGNRIRLRCRKCNTHAWATQDPSRPRWFDVIPGVHPEACHG